MAPDETVRMAGVIQLEDAKAVSPCRDLCTLDRLNGFCVGCLRTPEEILGWVAMGPAARRLVLAQLPVRRAALPGRPPLPGL